MENSFARAGAASLADIKSQIETDRRLSASRRASVCSAINRMGQALDMSLVAIPADVGFIGVKLSRLTPAEAGMTAKRFATVKSEVKWALKHIGIIDGGGYLHPIIGPWLKLWNALPSKYARTTFSRLFRYCSKHGISPNDVTDAVLLDFRRAVEAETFIKDPRVLHQNNARVWNQMRQVVDGWPDVELTVPRYADQYILDWDVFPDSLRADCNRFIARQSSDDLLDFDAPPRPLKPRTLRQYQYEIRRAASILVHCGCMPGALRSLSDLCQPERVADCVRYILARKGEKRSFSASDLAILLSKIARHYVKMPPEEVGRIKRIAARIRPAQGLSRKNRERLAPLRFRASITKTFELR